MTENPYIHIYIQYLYKKKHISFNSTLRKSCPFFTKLRIDKSGQNLVIKEICHDHNIDVNEERILL